MSFPSSWYLINTVTQVKNRATGTRDSRGNDVYATTTVQLSGCLVEPRLSFGTESTAGQEHVGKGLDLFCSDPEADITPTDRFIVDGVSWEVDGPVNRYRGSRMNNNFCHANLERVTG